MTAQDRAHAFLWKADEAEEEAEKSKDENVRAAWKKIAEEYRALARHQLRDPQ
jgi:hypothetical protein